MVEIVIVGEDRPVVGFRVSRAAAGGDNVLELALAADEAIRANARVRHLRLAERDALAAILTGISTNTFLI